MVTEAFLWNILTGFLACERIPVKPFMILLGLLVIALSIRTILKHQGVI